MNIGLLIWTAVAQSILHGSFVDAQCSSKPNPSKLTRQIGQVKMTSPAKTTQRCLWKFPVMETQQAVIIYLQKADMQDGKRCIAHVVFPGGHSRQCAVSKHCRIFTHENSSCSLAYMTSQKFPQCEKSIITSDNTPEKELRFVISKAASKRTSFEVKYKMIDCSRNSNDSIPSLDTGSLPITSLLKRKLTETNVTSYTTVPLVLKINQTDLSDATSNDSAEAMKAVYAMIAILLIVFICLIAVSVKLLLIKMRKTNSSFSNPTVVAYVHQGQRKEENESHRPDTSTSMDSIPSNTALYAEIGSGAWNANHEIPQYIELPPPSNPKVGQPENPLPPESEIPTENRHSTESRHSRNFPDYLYSKVNMLKKKRGNSHTGQKETRKSGSQRNSKEL